jgi:hypothetical protein
MIKKKKRIYRYSKAAVCRYFNAIENTHFFFFKGNDDVWRLATVNGTS